MAEWLSKTMDVVCPAHDGVHLEYLGHEGRDGEVAVYFRCPGSEGNGEVSVEAGPPHDMELVFVIEGQLVQCAVRERSSAQVTTLTDEQLAEMDGPPAATDAEPRIEFEAEMAQEQTDPSLPVEVDPTQQGDGPTSIVRGL